MARLPGGIGAKGSAQARFFHPIQHIREKWLNNHRTKRVLEVLLVGKGTHRANRKDQLCYECRNPEIDKGTVFHICCGNINIEESPSTPFEDEIVVRTVVDAPQDLERERTTAICESVVDVAFRMLTEDSSKKFQNSVSRGSRWTTTMSQPQRTLSRARQQPRPFGSG